MKTIRLTLDKIEDILQLLENGIQHGNLNETIAANARLNYWSEHLKNILPKEFVSNNFGNFDRHSSCLLILMSLLILMLAHY
jgi:hypothetical protein